MNPKPHSRSLVAALAALCALVVGLYAYSARSGLIDLLSSGRSEAYYNLLVRGFRAGHLSLARDVPPGLARLPDPYDPAANAAYRAAPDGVHDLSYWRGRLYLYFGITPALILFWPFAVVTGHYLLHREAAAIFCILAFLTTAGLLGALWRRYFTGTAAGVAAAGLLALGLVTAVPQLLARAEVYEVAIACGIMLTTLALAAIWCALHREEHRGRWLAAAGLALGLAVGARPSLLPVAAALLVPAWPARSARERMRLLLCAFAPLALAGAGLLLYNFLRFGAAGEFGQHYQLAADRQNGAAHFSLRYLWFNIRVYFLNPAAVTRHFPFVGSGAVPALPAGHASVEDPFGILADLPVVWLALAAPLAWRGRRQQAEPLRRFAGIAALAFGAIALPLALYSGACGRFEAEFLPPLVLLAVIGIFGLERALAGRRPWLWAARGGWGLLLALSIAFSLLAAVAHFGKARSDYGLALLNAGRTEDALQVLERVVALEPDLAAAHNNLGEVLTRTGRLPEALGQFAAALRLDPDLVAARENLASILIQTGRFAEAAAQVRQVLRLDPRLAEAHASLGYALAALDRLPEAIAQYEEALRLQPHDPRTHNGLGVALARSGDLPRAQAEFEAAVRLDPGYGEARENLVRVRALEITGASP